MKILKRSSVLDMYEKNDIDQSILQYLIDIRTHTFSNRIVQSKLIKDKSTVEVRFTISFRFMKNPYFQETFLTKTLIFCPFETSRLPIVIKFVHSNDHLI